MDLRTLSFLLSLLALVSACLVWTYGRLIPATRGSTPWTAASVCLAAAFGLLSRRGDVPFFLTVVAANSLLVAGAGLFHLALCRIRKAAFPLWVHLGALAAVAVSFQFVWNDLQGDYIVRLYLVNGLLAGQFTLCAWTLFRDSPSPRPKECRVVQLGVALFASLALTHVWRIVAHTGWFRPASTDILATDPSTVVMVLLVLGGQLAFPVVFVALNNLRTEMELHRSEEKFRSIVESSPTGMYFYSLEPDGRLLLTGCNAATEAITGVSSGTLLGKTLEEAFPGLAGTSIPEAYRRVARGEIGAQSFETVYRDDRFSGYYRLNIFRTGPGTIAVDCEDISERKRLEEELTRMATTDPLTGVCNRRVFLARAEEEFRRCKRYGIGMSVIMIDVDRFKDINDTHGHDVGDTVLKAVAAKSVEILRETDMFGRMGGEEFGVVLIHAGGHGGRCTAERLRRAYEALEVPTPSGPARLTASFGVASLECEDAGFELLLKRADKALYVAKRTGRNRVTAI